MLQIAAIILAVVCPVEPEPQDEAPLKPPASTESYTILNPTPRELMRPMSTDRPDTTESPVTVDAGHFQLEMSFVDWTYDYRNAAGETRRTLAVAPVNLKVGLLNSTDLQVVLQPWVEDRTKVRATGELFEDEGLAATTLRIKHNLWGNDGGSTALAVMPYITFPTGADGLQGDGVEGGLIVPFSIELPAEFELGLMAEVDFIRDGEAHPVEFLHTAVLGRELCEGLRGFIEYAGVASTHETYRAFFHSGLVFEVGADMAFDLGVRVGLSRESEDVGLFVGFSVRH
jgi:hypothetical protein